MNESLYFIAIVPPVEIQNEITEFKHEIANRFGSRHALNAPAHITLHMPFKWKEKKMEQLHHVIRECNEQLNPFELTLRGFDFFEPRVIFVKVESNVQLDLLQRTVVDNCRRTLKLDNGNYKSQGFHPHVTIGFRDLKKPMFFRAKQEFENRHYASVFTVKDIQLLQHDGKRWNIY